MDISVASIFGGFRARWALFVVSILTAWAAAGTYLVYAQPQYFAQADFYYADRSDRITPEFNTGIASLAASVGLGKPPTTGREIALAILNSRQLMRAFIEKYKLLPVLFAEKWDSTKETWTVAPDKVPTAALDGVEKFKNILTVSDDSLTGVISVAIRFSRRDIVASMANNFVALADDTQRMRALQESQESLNYLEEQLGKTRVTELRASFTTLIEQELQRITLTQITGRFAFPVIDTAIQPKDPVWPRPVLLLAIVTFLGLVAAASVSIMIDLQKMGWGPS